MTALIIAGLWPELGGTAESLQELADSLQAACPAAKVLVRHWDADLNELIQVIQQLGGPYLIIGHSFGGSTAVALSAAWGQKIDRMILLDPVPHDDPLMVRTKVEDQWVDAFAIPEAVIRCDCYLRHAGIIPPYSKPVASTSNVTNTYMDLGHSEFCSNPTVLDHIDSAAKELCV